MQRMHRNTARSSERDHARHRYQHQPREARWCQAQGIHEVLSTMEKHGPSNVTSARGASSGRVRVHTLIVPLITEVRGYRMKCQKKVPRTNKGVSGQVCRKKKKCGGRDEIWPHPAPNTSYDHTSMHLWRQVFSMFRASTAKPFEKNEWSKIETKR